MILQDSGDSKLEDDSVKLRTVEYQTLACQNKKKLMAIEGMKKRGQKIKKEKGILRCENTRKENKAGREEYLSANGKYITFLKKI